MNPGHEDLLSAGRRRDMEISIEYCGTCNYRPISAGLAMATEKDLGIKPFLVHSKEIGALEVRVDNNLIFSKMQTGRFPDHAEVIALPKTRR
jgi:selT/selW/selH-like putative selenoprotein